MYEKEGVELMPNRGSQEWLIRTVGSKVSTELNKAIQKHGSMKSAHEAYAVILEELDEFWDLVKQQKPNSLDMMKELLQISAMAQRAIIDLELDPNMCK